MPKWIDLPPMWLLACLVLAWAEARLVGLAPWLAALAPLGWLMVFASAALIAAAAWRFRAEGTSIVPRETPSALVTSGVYAFSRNPIYLADLGILAGISLALGSLLGLLLVPALGLVLRDRFIRPEEARLSTTFGSAYDAYETRVRRWF